MKWYKIEAKGDKAEVWIYEMIGEDFWTGGGVTAKNFQKDLASVKAKQIDLHINSPGGDVFDGITIYNLLKQHDAKVTTYIDGLAASIASVIALAGDKVYMAENALFMVHNPYGFAMGDANEMRKTADVLDKVRGSMITTYMTKTGKQESDVVAMLDAETWMDAEEALEAGFIDIISEKMDLAACAKFVPAMEKMGFKYAPKNFNASVELPPEREIERILRDAGCSKKQAKAILAEGYRMDCRDDDPPEATPVVGVRRDAEQPKATRSGDTSEILIRAARITAITNRQEVIAQ